MMNFYEMEKTHTNHGDGKYTVRVGNDYLEVETYLDSFNGFSICVQDHYIKNRYNKPKNPNRTNKLFDAVFDYLESLCKEEILEDMCQIAQLPEAPCLRKAFKGNRLFFPKNTKPSEIITHFEFIYTSAVFVSTGADTFFPLLNLYESYDGGFLFKELNSLFSI